MMKIVIGISGASGAIFGKTILEYLSEKSDVETHLIITEAAEKTIKAELGISVDKISALADYAYDNNDLASQLASGSFKFDAMIIAPCSVNSLSSIANGLTSNLLTRTADVALKERRKLVLMVRESPLHIGHLRSMVRASEMGAIIAPPMPAMYLNPITANDITKQIALRNLDLLGVNVEGEIKRWGNAL